MNDERCFAHLVEPGIGYWVEIEMEIIGSVNVVAPGIPWVKINATEVDNPKQGCQVTHDGEIDYAGVSMFNGAGVDPVGPGHRRALLEKERATSTGGVPLHDHGAINQVRQQCRADLGVVPKQIPFTNAFLAPENLLQIGQFNRMTIEIELCLRCV